LLRLLSHGVALSLSAVLAVVLSWGPCRVYAASSSKEDARVLAYEEYLKNIPLTPDKGMIEKARKAVPPNLNKSVEEERIKLMEGIFSGAGDVLEHLKDNAGKEKTLSKGLKRRSGAREGERIYVFISSSVPVHTLRNYARDFDAIKTSMAVMVMRGFVDGMKKAGPTLGFVRKILVKDPSCDGRKCEVYRVPVLIDPLLFRKYGINVVPAVVYAAKGDESYALYGDVSLDGALEMINKEAKSSRLDCLVRRLRRGPGYACQKR